MSIITEIQERSGNKCELCGATDNLSVYEVQPPVNRGAYGNVLTCNTCLEQIEDADKMDKNHWHCLNDSMWSEEDAVKVVAWRMLTRLGNQDLLDMMYLEDETKTWAEATKIVSSDRGVYDEFGFSVSISGNYAIVGEPFGDEDASGNNTMGSAGCAYIFERDTNGDWVQVQKIVASDRATQGYFGSSVSVSGDYAIVGAHYKNDTTGADTILYSGSAYVFKTNNATGIGVIENTFDSKLLLYPNPTDGNFSIDLGENFNSVGITIRDVNGRLIQSNNYYESQLLNLKLEEPSGLYLLIIESENQRAVIQIVKQ